MTEFYESPAWAVAGCMSDANVYRHFARKAALHDAVAERWLHRVHASYRHCVSPGLASGRIEARVLTLMSGGR